MKKITCCKNCQERCVGCHGNCENYLAEKAEHDNEKAMIEKQRNAPINGYLTQKRLSVEQYYRQGKKGLLLKNVY